LVQPVAIPCRARDVDERASLRRGLEVAFARGREGSRKLRDLPQAGIVARRRQSCKDAASTISPASTAHSMPLE
jgi:hypothetical protein